jgi:hypothetical protein
MPTTKEEAVPTQTSTTTKNGNGKHDDGADALAEALFESVEGLTDLAREQTEDSLARGERAIGLLRDETVRSVKGAESLGVSFLTRLASATEPFTPLLPRLSPVQTLDTAVRAGFDVAQQLVATQRHLAEATLETVGRRTR